MRIGFDPGLFRWLMYNLPMKQKRTGGLRTRARRQLAPRDAIAQLLLLWEVGRAVAGGLDWQEATRRQRQLGRRRSRCLEALAR